MLVLVMLPYKYHIKNCKYFGNYETELFLSTILQFIFSAIICKHIKWMSNDFTSNRHFLVYFFKGKAVDANCLLRRTYIKTSYSLGRIVNSMSKFVPKIEFDTLLYDCFVILCNVSKIRLRSVLISHNR